jgi:hypothetical protein
VSTIESYDFFKKFNPIVVMQVIRVWSCQAQPSPWIFPDSIYQHHSIGTILECHANGCLQEVLEQFKENLAFPEFEGLIWIHV